MKNVKAERKKIAEFLKNDQPYEAKDLALKMIAHEPSEAVNYKNLAICFASLNDKDRALATLDLGEKKTSDSSPSFWAITKCTILRYCNSLDHLADSLIDLICDPATGPEDSVKVLREHISAIDSDYLKNCLQQISTSIGVKAAAFIEIIYFLHENDFQDEIWPFIDEMVEAKAFDYEGRKRLSILLANYGHTSAALEILNELTTNPISSQYYRDDLKEIAKIHAKFGMKISESVATLKKVTENDPTDAEAYKLMGYYQHYSDLQSDMNEIRTNWTKHGSLLRAQHKIKFPLAEKLGGTGKKIGFLSASFKMHPVGWLTSGFFCEAPKFKNLGEVHILATAITDDFIGKTIRATGNKFHDLSDLDGTDLGRAIYDLNLDVIVDLEGCMVGSEIETLISKPSPILVKWVGGLVGSMWVTEYDYLITDVKQTPDEFDGDFCEKLIKLDECYVIYSPPPYKIRVHEPPFTLNNYITFGSFNNLSKLSPSCLDTWVDILKAVPDSRIVVKDTALSDSGAQDRVREEICSRGIKSSRITILEPTKHGEHLQHLQLVDIALDPFPYTGGLSTIEAFYMGTPVVALAGRLLSHRHSTTHLMTIQHHELLASSISEYVSIATELALDRERILEYRKTLRRDLLASPLLNHERFTEELLKKLAALVT